ncbi:dithiol-disulfide isomerase [Solibacillus sp. R5-41]|uniref:DsbA family oxidoreductase n=1 Tax=Solibacillus sp. R5-41 TaxID=2048654 RepID=UPI000C124C0B|nr:DsbA family oxidoreductase [Solibacillus sp. R5-41]ATP39764.1 dithiol-disulfide isomerase [Solibacillus sp. R5-41]
MKIELFSDFACPFCYIAKTRLQQAIQQLNLEDEVEIEYKAYQLDPGASKSEARRFYDDLYESKGQSKEKVNQLTDSIQAHADEVGLTFNFNAIQLANTENVHRLSKLAKVLGKESQFMDTMMETYFTKGINLNDTEQLLPICDQLNIPRNLAIEVLNSTQFSDELANDRYDTQQIQITSVPFFVFENQYGIKGVEPIEIFTKTLLQAQQVANIRLKVIGNDLSCGPDGCTL